MRVFFFIVSLFFCLSSYSQITIKVVLSGTPSDTTRLLPARVKYNKWGRLGITVDDQQKTGLSLKAYMTGGVAPENSVTYPGKTFTDGANVRAKNIKYRGSVAANAFWGADTTVSSWGLTSNNMTTSDMQGMIDDGWDLLDHGAFHELSDAGAANLGLTTLTNAAFNRDYQYRTFGYVTRVGVVPSAWADYHSAWEQLGYLAGSSQSINDGYPDVKFGWDNYGLVDISNWKTDNRYKVLLRRFKDFSGTPPFGDAVEFLDAATALANQATSTHNLTLEHGLHNVTLDTTIKCIDSFHTIANDHFWVCGLQEFFEYFQVIQQTGVKQTLSGDTLTVTLDQSFLPDATRWRDMSFLLSSNSSITSVTVTGADDYSYNTSTGLVNVYKKKTNGFTAPPSYTTTGFVHNQKIDLKKDDIFFDNNVQPYYDPSLGRMVDYGMLVDGDTTRRYSASLTGSLIYTPYEVHFDLTDYGAVVTKVRIYAAGTGFSTSVVLKRNDNNADSIIGTYTGGSGWVEFNKIGDDFVASELVLRSNSVAGFGTEVQVYADYEPYTEQTYPHRNVSLGYMLGVNSYPWDFIDAANPNVSEGKVGAFNTLKLRSLRNYADADFYSRDNGATWSFNPIRTGHYEDNVFRRLRQDNPYLIRWAVIQNQTTQVKQNWRDNPDNNYSITGTVTSYVDNTSYGVLTLNVTATTGAGSQPSNWRIDNTTRVAPSQYAEGTPVTIPTSLPASVQFYIGGGNALNYRVGDNVTAKLVYTSSLNLMYANNTDAGRSTPNTWDSIARAAYVYSARRGRNTHATVFSPAEFNNDSVGLGSADWTELMNEPNASWLGYDNYLNGKHLAYAWSKTYDNNKVTSTTLGARNADTSMKVSTSGLAINTIDLNRSADVTVRYMRGNRAKTTVATQPTYWKAQTFGWADNPYDVIQFHNYSYTGGANQFGAGINSGIPLELSPALQGVEDFVWFRNKYAPWAQVDVGEWGFDLHQGSPMNAPPIGSHSIDEVRAAWSLRTILMYHVKGIDVAQWYRLYSYDSTAIQFSTMSLLRDNGDNTFSRRLVGDYFSQIGEFADYTFDSTIREDSIRVYRWKKDTSYLYGVWGVENWTNYDSSFLLNAAKATFTERTGTYTLPLLNGTTVHTRRLLANATTMADVTTTVSGTGYQVTYGLTPIFIQTGSGTTRKKRTIVYF